MLRIICCCSCWCRDYVHEGAAAGTLPLRLVVQAGCYPAPPVRGGRAAGFSSHNKAFEKAYQQRRLRKGEVQFRAFSG